MPRERPEEIAKRPKKKKKNYICTKTCTQMFTEALFITAKTWKQSTWPSVDEPIKKLWSIQTMDYYSARKRNELLSNENTWRHLKACYQGKKAIWKGYILYDSSHSAFWKRQTFGGSKKKTKVKDSKSGFQRLGGREGTEGFQSSQTLLHDTVVAIGVIAHLSKLRMCSTKSELWYRPRTLGDNDVSMWVPQL